MRSWTRDAYTKTEEAVDEGWIWGSKRIRRKKKQEPQEILKGSHTKPERGKYWIVTTVRDDMPYYLTDVEKRGERNITYTWNHGEQGQKKAVIFRSEDEAWDTAYKCRGTVITQVIKERQAEGCRNEADEN